MRACKRCKWAIPEKDGNVPFYICALFPPNADGRRPAMTPIGWCGQFKLSLKRLIWGHGSA